MQQSIHGVWHGIYTHVGCVFFIVASCLKFSFITIIHLYVHIVPLGGAVIFYSILYLNKIPPSHRIANKHTYTHTCSYYIWPLKEEFNYRGVIFLSFLFLSVGVSDIGIECGK